MDGEQVLLAWRDRFRLYGVVVLEIIEGTAAEAQAQKRNQQDRVQPTASSGSCGGGGFLHIFMSRQALRPSYETRCVSKKMKRLCNKIPYSWKRFLSNGVGKNVFGKF